MYIINIRLACICSHSSPHSSIIRDSEHLLVIAEEDLDGQPLSSLLAKRPECDDIQGRTYAVTADLEPRLHVVDSLQLITGQGVTVKCKVLLDSRLCDTLGDDTPLMLVFVNPP